MFALSLFRSKRLTQCCVSVTSAPVSTSDRPDSPAKHDKRESYCFLLRNEEDKQWLFIPQVLEKYKKFSYYKRITRQGSCHERSFRPLKAVF